MRLSGELCPVAGLVVRPLGVWSSVLAACVCGLPVSLSEPQLSICEMDICAGSSRALGKAARFVLGACLADGPSLKARPCPPCASGLSQGWAQVCECWTKQDHEAGTTPVLTQVRCTCRMRGLAWPCLPRSSEHSHGPWSGCPPLCWVCPARTLPEAHGRCVGQGTCLHTRPSLVRDVLSGCAPAPHRQGNCTLELQSNCLAQQLNEREMEQKQLNKIGPGRCRGEWRRAHARAGPGCGHAHSRSLSPSLLGLPAPSQAVFVARPCVPVSSRPCIPVSPCERRGRAGCPLRPDFLISRIQKDLRGPCLSHLLNSSPLARALRRLARTLAAPSTGCLLCPWDLLFGTL